MRILDRYLLRQYFEVLAICFVSLAGLYTVIDAFGRIDDFLVPGTNSGEALAKAARYYGLQSLGFFNRTSGLLAMIAAMFTVTWLQRHNEMTALSAAGVSRLKALRPVLVASLCVSLTAAAMRETLLPALRPELSLDSRDFRADHSVPLLPRYDNATDLRIGGERAVVRTATILRPSFTLPPRLANDWGKQIVAAEAQFLPAEGGRPQGYLMKGVTQPAGVDTRPTLRTPDGAALVITRRDAPQLAPGEVLVVSGVSFELLAIGAKWRDLASTSELVHELASPSTELGPDVRVAVHGRLVQPLLDATLLLLGLPLVTSRGLRSPFLAIGLSVGVVTAFYVVALGGQALGANGWMRPSFAAWLPLMVFAPVAAALFPSLRD